MLRRNCSTFRTVPWGSTSRFPHSLHQQRLTRVALVGQLGDVQFFAPEIGGIDEGAVDCQEQQTQQQGLV